MSSAAVQSTEIDGDVTSLRVMLFNDQFNTRARVAAALIGAGLSPQAAESAMVSAHTTGRGLVKEYPVEESEAAVKLSAELRGLDLLVEVENVRVTSPLSHARQKKQTRAKNKYGTYDYWDETVARDCKYSPTAVRAPRKA